MTERMRGESGRGSALEVWPYLGPFTPLTSLTFAEFDILDLGKKKPSRWRGDGLEMGTSSQVWGVEME